MSSEIPGQNLVCVFGAGDLQVTRIASESSRESLLTRATWLPQWRRRSSTRLPNGCNAMSLSLANKQRGAQIWNVFSAADREEWSCRAHKSWFILDTRDGLNGKSPGSSWRSGSQTGRKPGRWCWFQGSSVKTGTCETCGLSQQHCIGHFGYVKLSLPVFHIGYFKNTLTICQCICKVLSSCDIIDLF